MLTDAGTRPTPSSSSASEAEARASLRRAAEAANISVELQPCQHINGFALPFPRAVNK